MARAKPKQITYRLIGKPLTIPCRCLEAGQCGKGLTVERVLRRPDGIEECVLRLPSQVVTLSRAGRRALVLALGEFDD
jgi:hypothetical protein